MEKKELFLENESWSKEASELDLEVRDTLMSIFKKWNDKGYNVRDIGHVSMGAVLSCEIELVARNYINYKKTTNAKATD